MRSKAHVSLIEQSVMLLVFAISAAMCLQVFLWSDRTAKENTARDRAVIWSQNVAETLKSLGKEGGDKETVLKKAADLYGGTYEQELLKIECDTDWNVISSGDKESAYCLYVQEEPDSEDGLCQLRIWVITSDNAHNAITDNNPLFAMTVAWQEVTS